MKNKISYQSPDKLNVVSLVNEGHEYSFFDSDRTTIRLGTVFSVKINGLRLEGNFRNVCLWSPDSHYYAIFEAIPKFNKEQYLCEGRLVIVDIKKSKFLNGPIHPCPLYDFDEPPPEYYNLNYNDGAFNYGLDKVVDRKQKEIMMKYAWYPAKAWPSWKKQIIYTEYSLEMSRFDQNWGQLLVTREENDGFLNIDYNHLEKA